MDDSNLSGEVIGAAIEVHRLLGPGLLESAYELALARELALRGVRVERQKAVPLEYKGTALGDGFRIDLLVQEQVIVEIKAVERIQAIHEAQLLTYLRLADKRLGLLINFNEKTIKEGVKRVVKPRFC
ncbi:MAG: GxxExxY protein [Propionivibrio sp.]|jgi:GxxExxY protein|uniref:GxxExxY protein n=1 Tax=Propionivibrio sp. TaxID=2212460 RepID=UPI001B64AFFF|nr:GxxExxY protein [Propionivibrio sp.]MBP7202343.1 GxxExxY protein [Propionivibrio sp.]